MAETASSPIRLAMMVFTTPRDMRKVCSRRIGRVRLMTSLRSKGFRIFTALVFVLLVCMLLFLLFPRVCRSMLMLLVGRSWQKEAKKSPARSAYPQVFFGAMADSIRVFEQSDTSADSVSHFFPASKISFCRDSLMRSIKGRFFEYRHTS